MSGAAGKKGEAGGGKGRKRASAGGSRSDLPRRLGDIITPALDRLAGGDEARAYAAWARAVGDPVAGGTQAEGVSPRPAHHRVRFVGLGQRAHLPRAGDPAPHGRGRAGAPRPAIPLRHRPPPGAAGRGSRWSGAGCRGVSGAGFRALRDEGEVSARTVRTGRARCRAGPGGRGRRRTTPSGYRGRSATVIAGAPHGSRSRHPVWLTKTAGLRRFWWDLRVALSLRFCYTHAGRSCLPPATLSSPSATVRSCEEVALRRPRYPGPRGP